MYQRTEPLAVPTSRRYVRIGFEDGPSFVFRRPGLDDLERIIGRFDRAAAAHANAMREILRLSKLEQTEETALAAIECADTAAAAQVQIAAGAGYLIGRTWADPAWALEANDRYDECAAKSEPYPAPEGLESWAAYGVDVYREVCDEVGAAETIELASQIKTATGAWLTVSGPEVKRKAKVFPPT
jgi:hypothetical protein